MNLSFDITELHDGQGHDQNHQDHRLRRSARIVKAPEPVGIDLVDQQIGRPARPAAGQRVDNAKAVGETVVMLITRMKKNVGASSGN